MRPTLLACITWMSLSACTSMPPAPPTASPQMRAMNKINFDLSQIDADGLTGPSDGKTLFAYEFCVPDHAAKLDEVKAIDPSLQCTVGSPGRIGCAKDQYLCIGEGGTRETLLKLASLDYVARIDPFYGE